MFVLHLSTYLPILVRQRCVCVCVCVCENSSAVHGGNRDESTGVCRRGFVSRILTHSHGREGAPSDGGWGSSRSCMRNQQEGFSRNCNSPFASRTQLARATYWSTRTQLARQACRLLRPRDGPRAETWGPAATRTPQAPIDMSISSLRRRSERRSAAPAPSRRASFG